MNSGPLPDGERDRFRQRIRSEEKRKVRMSSRGTGSAWLALGMFGVVGWTVAVPTLLGAVLGGWLDRKYPGGHSWTLALLVAGLTIGCFQAWLWVKQENEAIQKEEE